MLMIGARLRLTREVYQMNQSEFSAEIGVAQNLYSMYEGGKRRPGIETAQRISDKFKVSLDWIYDGKLTHLSFDMANKLLSAAKKLDANPHAKSDTGEALQAAIEHITKSDYLD